MIYETRIELWCGSEKGKTLDEAERRYRKADRIARQFNIPTSFEISQEKLGDPFFADGYVYPPSNKLLAVLDALDLAEVEYDNVDIPFELEGSTLHSVLESRFADEPVVINVGAIGARKPGKYTDSFSEFRKGHRAACPIRTYHRRRR